MTLTYFSQFSLLNNIGNDRREEKAHNLAKLIITPHIPFATIYISPAAMGISQDFLHTDSQNGNGIFPNTKTRTVKLGPNCQLGHLIA